jgi:hypothetical protein
MKAQTKKTKVTEAIRSAGDYLQRKRLQLIADDPNFAASIVQEIEAEVGDGLDEASRTQRALALVQARILKQARDARRQSDQSDKDQIWDDKEAGRWFLQASLAELRAVVSALSVAETGEVKNQKHVAVLRSYALAQLGHDDPRKKPTVTQVSEQLVKTYGVQGAPADWSLRRMLKQLRLSVSRGKRGRPSTPETPKK